VGEAVSRRLPRPQLQEYVRRHREDPHDLRRQRTRFEIECYDIGYLYTLAHFVDRGLVRPPFFVQSVFGILGGIGPHPEDVMHMRRTADRLFGKGYHWSVLGAGRNQMTIAAQALALGVRPLQRRAGRQSAANR
jgi:uncharacterized protein (DUF849 family)